jgi:hypothetical protein
MRDLSRDKYVDPPQERSASGLYAAFKEFRLENIYCCYSVVISVSGNKTINNSAKLNVCTTKF